MGIHERQEREREAVRRAILDAARQLFVTEGFGNVTMRRLAERIEYSPSAIYSYFESKDEIFLELAEEGFRLLMRPAEDGPPADPVERLRRHYARFHDFACRYPEYFAVMFLERRLPAVRDREQFAFLHDLKQQGPRLIRVCVDTGAFPPGIDTDAAARVLWAAVHGAAVIRVTWPAAAGLADVLASNVLKTVLAGLRAGVVLEPVPDPMVRPVETGVAAGAVGRRSVTSGVEVRSHR